MTEANLKLLGSTLRHFREQAQPKKISQFRLATLMQWEGTAPIIEIEKGRRRPRPETIEALGEALQLSPANVAYLQGLAGYRELTVLPSVSQLKRVLQAIEPEIGNRLYPAYVMDYLFRIWMVNTASAVMLGGSVALLTMIMQQRVHSLNLVFDSRLPLRHYLADSAAFEQEGIFRFKYHNLYRRHEPFYRAYPECMKAALLPADYKRFAHCWQTVDVGAADIFPIHPQISLRLGENTFTFVMHIVELLHFDRLIYVAYYEPQDDGAGNRERCEALFTHHSPGNKGCLCAWDFTNEQP